MSKEKINPLKQEKLNKLQELLEMGVNPYPHSFSKKRSGSLELANSYASLKSGESDETKLIHLAGRLMRKRPMGKAAFFNIQDEKGEFQCYIKRDDFSSKEEKENPWRLWKLCDIGDVLGLTGTIFKTQKGELSLKIQDLKILCKSLEPLPEKFHGLEDKELKYRYRHLDLIMDPKSREVFETRSQVIREIRSFMHTKGFMEVETPVLQAIYGGAAAQPFETHFRSLNQKMYLKISPEIYLKKLIVGGFEKVFEIGKNFRNEGMDRTHNPEFCMMEYYQAYTDYEDQMKQFEELVCYVTAKIKGSLQFEYQGRKIDFKSPWERITVKEAVKKYSGKKNIDFDKISYPDLFSYVQSLEIPKDFEKFEKALKEESPDSEILKNLKDELLFMAFEEIAEKNFWNPVFVTDFPLVVSPLTKKHRENPRLVERFEPYIAGMELGNAYTELNDPIDQRQRLESQKRWDGESKKAESEKGKDLKSPEENFHPLDENFLHALEVGMPPTGGVGLGIERLVMILSDQSSIKDSMLFPVLKNKD